MSTKPGVSFKKEEQDPQMKCEYYLKFCFKIFYYFKQLQTQKTLNGIGKNLL